MADDVSVKHQTRPVIHEREKLRFAEITGDDLPQVKEALHKIFKVASVPEEAYASISAWEKQKNLVDAKKTLYDLCYWALKNEEGKVCAVIGIYTVQTSAPGFSEAEGKWAVARGGWGGVVEEERGKGYGKLIIEFALSEAKKNGAAIFLAETSPIWSEMHSIFREFGFDEGANVRNYYGEGIDLLCLYAELGKVETGKIAVGTVEVYDATQLEWLREVFGKEKFALLKEVVEKAAYWKKNPFESLIEANPTVIEEKGRPIGFAVLSNYTWEGPSAKALKATFVAAETGKEKSVAAALVRKAKDLGMRMVVFETPENQNLGLQRAFKDLGFASSSAITGLYGTYTIDGKDTPENQLIFAKKLAGWTPSSPLWDALTPSP
jgi:GNAT superfamily N-acetyltransferase